MRMQTIGLLLAATLAMTAGCIGETNPQEDDADETGAPLDANATQEKPTTVALYALSEAVTGASPPSPLDHGAVATQAPVAKADTFEVAENITRLTVQAEATSGAGSARLEIHGPDGGLVFSTATYYMAGAPNAPTVILSNAATERAPAGDPAPGTYTVTYHVGGTIQFDVTIRGQEAAE